MIQTLVRPLAVGAALACTAPGVLAADAAATPVGHRLNDTGIGFCIDADGHLIDCKGTGQDATTGRDVTRPRDSDGRVGFHFTRYCNSGQQAGQGTCPPLPPAGDAPDEWGCTRDDVTKLLWETKTESGPRSGDRIYTFYSPHYDPAGQYGGPHDATGYMNAVNAAGLCGLHDWRLPTPVELMGIVDMGITTLPAIDLRFMPNTRADFYWAAGAVRGEPFGKQLGWGSDFAFELGDISSQFRESPRPVRLVHGAELGGQRFVISDDQQEVTDLQTRLVWRRCVEGRTSIDGRCKGVPLELPWPRALERAKGQARHAGVAWRLPNVKELASLLDHRHLPHIDTHAFPGADHDFLWTSSSFPADSTPRCVDFPNGDTFACSQGSNTFGSRLVRDGD